MNTTYLSRLISRIANREPKTNRKYEYAVTQVSYVNEFSEPHDEQLQEWFDRGWEVHGLCSSYRIYPDSGGTSTFYHLRRRLNYRKNKFFSENQDAYDKELEETREYLRRLDEERRNYK